jgi:branched-chain amino acid aminotransferase
MEYLHNFFILNGNVKPCSNIEIKGNIIVYEVLRIMNGVPLFLPNHLKRLEISASMLKKRVPFSNPEFNKLIQELIITNKIIEGNIKITLEYQENASVIQSLIGFIPHSYPSPQEYTNGVKTVTSIDQRINPKAKVQNDELRTRLNNLMKKENAYEAILVHPEGFITEGSRSNIFFVKDKTIITAPDELVLGGITRDFIIKICKEKKISIQFEALKFPDINKMDGAFISGTSPKVLPINKIDSCNYTLPNPGIQYLTQEYDNLIQTYINTHQK